MNRIRFTVALATPLLFSAGSSPRILLPSRLSKGQRTPGLTMLTRILTATFTSVAILISTLAAQASDGVHLLMLTGDERMQNLDENVSFLPLLQPELAEANVVVVKAAYQKKHLGHWHDNWSRQFRGRESQDDAQGWIFDELIQKARAATDGRKVQSVTLVWAQGTSDTGEGFVEPYDESFRALTDQLANELGRDDINCVIARLGLLSEPSKRHPEWDALRTIQAKLGDSLPNASWVDTDPIGEKAKDYSEALGKLLAEATLEHIRKNTDSETAALPARKTPKKKHPAHLFLLSGQSNMAGLDPEEAFVPAVIEAFSEDGAIVVKAAYGAKAIRHWYQPNSNKTSDTRNWLYRELIGKAKFAIADREIQSVTLCWMQGEADAGGEASANAYAENFEGLLRQLREDLSRDDINFVIGRLSDHSNPGKYEAWDQMRSTQEEIADSTPRGRWIDTDAFNGDDDNLHYPSGENGKVALARAFATQSIELARSAKND
ncbi:MAG: sialate O-acetylesterase [Verrucomicrobiota bacterium]